MKLFWLKGVKTITLETAAYFLAIKVESHCRIRSVLVYDTHFYLDVFAASGTDTECRRRRCHGG